MGASRRAQTQYTGEHMDGKIRIVYVQDTERERDERLKRMTIPVGVSKPRPAQEALFYVPCKEHGIPYEPNTWTCRTCTDRHIRGLCAYPPGDVQPCKITREGINTSNPITIPAHLGPLHAYTRIGENMNGENNTGESVTTSDDVCTALGITPEQLAAMQATNATPQAVPAPVQAPAPVQWTGPFDTEEENVHFNNVMRVLNAQPDIKRAQLAAALGWDENVLTSWMSNPKVVCDTRFATTVDGKARPSLKWLRQFVQALLNAPAPVPEPVPVAVPTPAVAVPQPVVVVQQAPAPAPVPSPAQPVPAPAPVQPAPVPGPTAEQLAMATAILESAGQQVVPQGQYAAPAPAAPTKASGEDVAYAMRAAEGLKAIGKTLVDCGFYKADFKRVNWLQNIEPDRIEKWVASQGYNVDQVRAHVMK